MIDSFAMDVVDFLNDQSQGFDMQGSGILILISVVINLFLILVVNFINQRTKKEDMTTKDVYGLRKELSQINLKLGCIETSIEYFKGFVETIERLKDRVHNVELELIRSKHVRKNDHASS